MNRTIQLLLGILFLCLQNAKAQKQTFSEQPKWVKPIDIPSNSTASKYDILSGYYITLGDYQINLEENAIFNHEVMNVVSYSGITGASQLSVIYDTSYQKLYINHLYIWRKGKKTDRTKDLSFEVLNNENKLNQGIYTGQITSYDVLNDIRKDDLIDFAYTLVGKNPIFDNGKYLFIPLESINPIDKISLRVLYKKGNDYSYECVNCDSIQVSKTDLQDYQEISINIDNLKALEIEDNIPTWLIYYKYFTLSSFKSWKDVNTWAQGVFSLLKEPQLDAVFDEIFTGKEESLDEKINKVINYVQDDIRYMGIESGIGSIKPFPPEEVVQKRFGDCKDKSLLLVSLFKKLGLEKSYPVLANVFLKQNTDIGFPSNEVFNHCIVKFEYNNKVYWVDPTITMQGGDFKDLFVSDYGNVLVIGQPEDTLSAMSPINTNTGSDITEELTIKSFWEPAELKMVSNRFGGEADKRRMFLEYNKSQDLLDMVSNDLKMLYPTVTKLSDLKVKDDIDKNISTVTYHFKLDGFWQDGDKEAGTERKGYWYFKYEPTSMYQYFKVMPCNDRKFDLQITHPVNENYHMIFKCPQDMLVYDQYQSFDNEAFFFEKKIQQLSPTSFQIDYSFKTKAEFINVKEYKKVCEHVNQIAKDLPLILYFPK